MTTSGPLLTVAVDVTPRLFSDALTRALEHHDVKVVTLASTAASGDDHLDVVVTSSPGGNHLPPDVVIVEVRPGAGLNPATPASSAMAQPDVVRNLDDLMALIRRFAGPDQPTPA